MNNSLIEYSLQLSMLSILFSRHLLSEVEYKKIKIKLMKKYNISTDLYS
ncbi:SHOCT domain-containing protein [Veillonella sp.]|nr:SHOCT domain-containing protein [Veillonella sp.]MDU1127720.1 SHOCT domain-containing protein [Veillonella sp.]